MPLVTVLTAVRNGIRYLPETIASIQAQSVEDWEYILVDDGSVDKTPQLIDEVAKRDPRIKLLRRLQAGGPFVAAIEGLRWASGKYVVRTDADDVSLPNRISTQVKFLEANCHLRACATFCQSLNEDNPSEHYVHDAPLTAGSLKWYLWLRCPLVHSSACVERKALVDTYSAAAAVLKYRQWSESAEGEGSTVIPDVEDYRMWCNLARLGWLAVVPEVLVQFRKHRQRVSVIRKAQQESLALGVLNEHVKGICGDTWTPMELKALYAVGHASQWPVELGLEGLHRWDVLWMSDRKLMQSERDELVKLSAFRRRKFIRNNAKAQPVICLKRAGRFLFPRPRT
jgi:glycosyltransferase involved in cell wall biosynthesis